MDFDEIQRKRYLLLVGVNNDDSILHRESTKILGFLKEQDFHQIMKL